MPHTSDNSSASPRALSFGAVAADYDRYLPAGAQHLPEHIAHSGGGPSGGGPSGGGPSGGGSP